MTAACAPSLLVLDQLIADLAEGHRTIPETRARLMREGFSPDLGLIQSAVRAFWLHCPEPYDQCLAALLVREAVGT